MVRCPILLIFPPQRQLHGDIISAYKPASQLTAVCQAGGKNRGLVRRASPLISSCGKAHRLTACGPTCFLAAAGGSKTSGLFFVGSWRSSIKRRRIEAVVLRAGERGEMSSGNMYAPPVVKKGEAAITSGEYCLSRVDNNFLIGYIALIKRVAGDAPTALSRLVANTRC